jgi:CarboxypepD_reg-like domain
MKVTTLILSIVVLITTVGKAQIITINGKILDNKTQLPIPYANIGIPRLSIGTSANEKGEFIVKIDQSHEKETLVCSSIGYISDKLNLIDIKNKESLTIQLKPTDNVLKELIVKPIDAQKIMARVVEKRTENYATSPALMEGFYREYVKERGAKSYIVHSEGILEMYKASVKKDDDRVRLIKGRQRAFNKTYIKDSIAYRIPPIANGPQVGIILDIIKSSESFVNNRKQYKFEFDGYTHIQERCVYIITFEPKYPEKYSSVDDYNYFKGKVYVDTTSLAIVRAEYGFSENGYILANRNSFINHLVLQDREFIINYSLFQYKWYLQSVHVKNNYSYIKSFDISKNTLILDNTMTFYITKIETENVKIIPRKEAIKIDETLKDKIAVSDDSFWGDYNFIKDIDN